MHARYALLPGPTKWRPAAASCGITEPGCQASRSSLEVRFRVLLLSLALPVAGCSLLQVPSADAPPAEVTPEPAVEEPAPAPPPQPRAEPVPEPRPAPAPPPASFESPVAVVMSSRAPAYESVAVALADRLPASEVYDLSDRSLSPRDAFARIAASEAHAVVAIGLRAALFARDYAEVPVVFSQVFNVADNQLSGDHIRGVAVLPPLDGQLDAWLALSPALSSIGAIVGPGHEDLLAEAAAAAKSRGLEFHFHVANSDRETLYLFTRLVPDIDAFWLFPDNRVLSASVLQEMMSYAARHRVAVAVFNESLMELGPAISTTADETDIAYVIMRVLHRIEAGDIDDVPELSPLGEVRVVQKNGRPAAARISDAAAQDDMT